MKSGTTFIINATKLTSEDNCAIYEFVFDFNLEIIECSYISSLAHNTQVHIDNFCHKLKNCLFELNHVRVNPQLDNRKILKKLTKALLVSGVEIHNQQDENFISYLYQPLGELSEIVRFYITLDAKATFLSSAVKLHLVTT